MFEKCFLQDVRHNLREILSERGRRSGLRRPKEGKIYRKVAMHPEGAASGRSRRWACRLQEWFFKHALRSMHHARRICQEKHAWQKIAQQPKAIAISIIFSWYSDRFFFIFHIQFFLYFQGFSLVFFLYRSVIFVSVLVWYFKDRFSSISLL